MFKNVFKIFSYIQKMTTEPINALKITIYNTKHTKITKSKFSKTPQKLKFQHKKNIFSIKTSSKWSAFYAGLYGIIYNLYMFVYFVYFCIYWYIDLYNINHLGPNIQTNLKKQDGPYENCSRFWNMFWHVLIFFSKNVQKDI